MILRETSEEIKKFASYFPVVDTGTRQSGKTTLVKNIFPKYQYFSLENPDTRQIVLNDPRGFLNQFHEGVVIDEAQRIPEIFSYIQSIIDEVNKPGMFVLSGSQNFLLIEKITQSLAGRSAIIKLLPFSLEELKRTSMDLSNPLEQVYKGFYPRIYDAGIPSKDFYSFYIQTCIERDIKLLRNTYLGIIYSRFSQNFLNNEYNLTIYGFFK